MGGMLRKWRESCSNEYACISMTTKTERRVRGKGLTRHLVRSSPPALLKLGWMTPRPTLDR
jgi:hypothetical protein